MHRMTLRSIALATCGIVVIFLPAAALAQTIPQDTQVVELSKVLQVLGASTTDIEGTGTAQPIQLIDVKVLQGPDAGKELKIQNDYTQLSVGEMFYLMHTASANAGPDYYSVSDPYRLNVLGILALVFVALIFVFGGLPGIRGLASLVGSLLLIFFVLIPGILGGYSPVLVSIGVASLIILVGSYLTHGFNKTTTAAVLGMLATVLVTGAGAYLAVHAAHLTGYTSEEVVSLNFATHGTIDLVGLVFGGIMIGLLGVLYDIAIGQAIAVEELFRAGSHMTRAQVLARGIRIGREHIGALVNTLAIAYVGAALPLLLLVQSSTFDYIYMLNSEVFATEFIRIFIGSIGLILGAPITTLIATYLLSGEKPSTAPSGHTHGHFHQ